MRALRLIPIVCLSLLSCKGEANLADRCVVESRILPKTGTGGVKFVEFQRVITNYDRKDVVVATCLVLLLLSTVAVTIVTKQARSMDKKNRALTAQISEYEHQEETPAPVSPGDMTDEQLFRHITGIIRRQKMFLDPNFGRQTLMDAFGLSKDRAGRIFSRGNDDYARISDFINDCRLEYSRPLLLNEPNRSLADIAAASGFTHYGTFGRLFKKKYALTPTQYRRQHLR